ncbi:MAG TPA: hypothetical protein VNW90_25165 [Acetobacteraceae bacterium]|jgi:hypothetical protein|nr:hypothetical protein [Acetobacteraceae bacterium]
MKDFSNSWLGIIVGVVGSAIVGHYFGFLGWLLFFVAIVLFVLKHSKDAGQV